MAVPTAAEEHEVTIIPLVVIFEHLSKADVQSVFVADVPDPW